MMTFFDETSKTVYNQFAKSDSPIHSSVMLNIERFEIGSRYVTAKVENRYGESNSIINGCYDDDYYYNNLGSINFSRYSRDCLNIFART